MLQTELNSTEFSEVCSWSPLDKKLSCSGRNEKVKAQIVSWTVDSNNMVNVRTAAEDNLQIHAKEVEILNIDENKIGRKEFERLVSRFPNLQDLMQYKKALSI